MKSTAIKSIVYFGAALCLLLSTGVLAAPGAQVKLQGQNDANVDRQAIQDAIDSAPGENLTVKLKGIFQLDGQDLIVDRSDIVIKGEKSGATLLGKLGPDGLPIDDIDNFPNRGFLIGSENPLTNVEIKDLAFSGFRTPIFVRGEENAIGGVSVRNNNLENSIFGVVVTGASSDIFIADNIVLGATDTAINVFSTGAGDVRDITIVDNHLADALGAGLYIAQVSGAIIANNFMSTSNLYVFLAPFFVDGLVNSGFRVEGNVIQGGSVAAILLGDASDFVVTRNCFRDGGTQGHPFFSGGGIQVGYYLFGFTGSGFEIADNSYEGNVAAGVPRDVWLDPNSSNTSVLERNGTIVLDQGAFNSVTLVPDSGTNYCD